MVLLCPGMWRPSHRALVVLCPASCLWFRFGLLTFACVSLFGLLGVGFILWVVVQESFAARQGGPFWESTLGELPVIRVLKETGGLGLLQGCGSDDACAYCWGF